MKTYVAKIAPVFQTDDPACINGINICSMHSKLPPAADCICFKLVRICSGKPSLEYTETG